MANKENIPLYIKERFSILDNANQNMESIFNIIHQQDERVFTEYIDSFILKEVTYTHFKSYVKKCAQYLLNNTLTVECLYMVAILAPLVMISSFLKAYLVGINKTTQTAISQIFEELGRISFIFIFWLCCAACGLSIPQPGMEPVAPALEGKILTTGPPGTFPRLIHLITGSLLVLK